LAILLGIPVAIAIAWTLSLIPRLALRYYRKKKALTDLPPIRLFHIGPGTLLLSTFIHYIFVFLIGASIVYRQYYRRVLWVLLAIGAYWLVTRITKNVSARVISRLTAEDGWANVRSFLLRAASLKSWLSSSSDSSR